MMQYPKYPKNYFEIEKIEIECGLRKKEDVFTTEKTAHGLGRFSIENENPISLRSAVLFVKVSRSKPFLKARMNQIKEILERKRIFRNQSIKNL
jgi:hypothetical protein